MKKRFDKKYQFLPAALMLSCLVCGCGNAEVKSAEATSVVTEAVVTEVVATEAAIVTENVKMVSDYAIDIVTDIATTQYFTEEAVAEEDINTILLSGINAPSAMNGQKWHFSAITDTEVLQRIADGMGGGMPPAGFAPDGMTPPAMPDGKAPTMPEPPALGAPDGNAPAASGGGSKAVKAGVGDVPLAIVISGAAGSELDAGLACQNMSVTAQLLGYGTKIVTSATMALNGASQEEYKELLGIPDEYTAIAVLLIGHEDTSVDETMDGYTGASVRNPFDEKVTYVTP